MANNSQNGQSVTQDVGSIYYIHPSENPTVSLVSEKFNGDNYADWKRGMILAFSMKNKLAFIDGSVAKPEPGDPLYHAWERCNNMVISYLLRSMDNTLSKSVMFLATAEEIWKDLEDRYSVISVDGISDLEDVTWKDTYDTIFKAAPQYNPIYVYADCLMAGARLGGVIMSSSVWVGALDHALSADLNQHGHFVSNLLPGLWVTDVYNGICPYCEAVCDETITMLSLWHSKLHLMDGFEEFCPDIIDIKHTDSRSGFIVDPSADSLALALSNLLDSRSIKIDGLGLEYIVSEQGLAVEFTDDEAKKLETEFKITRDSMNRVVAIQIQHIGHHIPSMKD